MINIKKQKDAKNALSFEEYEKRKVIAFNIDRLARERGMKPKDLAEKYGCSEGYVSGVKTCQHAVGFTSFRKWADIFKVDIFEFAKSPIDINLEPLKKKLKDHPELLRAVEAFVDSYIKNLS